MPAYSLWCYSSSDHRDHLVREGLEKGEQGAERKIRDPRPKSSCEH